MKSTPRKRLSADERRGQIVSHAMRRIGSQGFKSVSMRDIAHDAGINEALIYRHFPSKKALLRHVVDSIKENRPQFSQREPEGKGEFLEVLRGFEQFFLETNSRNATTLRIILYAVLEDYPLPEEFDLNRRGTFLNWLIGCIEKGKSDWGFRRDIDPRAAVSMFMGSLVYYVIQNVVVKSKGRRIGRGALAEMFLRALEQQGE
jgi:AcrR family transcriptional regulator